MAVNKVVYDGSTLIDITDSTVSPQTLSTGAVAYDASGERIVGEMTSGGREIGEMFYSSIPLDTPGIMELKGAVLSVGGMYDKAITKIVSKRLTNPRLFCSEAEWQSTVSAFGVCGRFVYTEGVSLRLPKMNNLSYIVLSGGIEIDEDKTTIIDLNNEVSSVRNDFTAFSESLSGEFGSLRDTVIDELKTRGLPVGTWIDFGGSTPPAGYLVRNGEAVSRTVYAELFKAIGTTYGEGDGVTTFNLPNSIDYPYTRSVIAEQVGSLFEAGLPNVTGKYNTGDRRTHIVGTEGAFYQDTIESGNWGGYANSPGNTQGVGFDASRSNPIYGRTPNEVRPKSIGTLPCIKAFDAPVQTGSVTVEELMEAVRDIRTNFMLIAHPIGSYYWSSEPTSPAVLFGGEWEAVTGKFIYASDDEYPVGSSGGKKTHTHKYGLRYGGWYGSTVLENAPDTGVLIHGSSSEGPAGSVGAGNSGTYGRNGVLTNSTRNEGGALYDSISDTSIESNMPPLESAYCWRRTA